jgi:hypothetical protein
VTEPIVRAGGGIVWRRGQGGGVEIVLVHRPAYDDWSFPKGKLHPGETEAQAALREVQEETGLRCRVGREVGTAAYRDPKRRPKTVRYWERPQPPAPWGRRTRSTTPAGCRSGTHPGYSPTTMTDASSRVGSRLGERSRLLSSHLEPTACSRSPDQECGPSWVPQCLGPAAQPTRQANLARTQANVTLGRASSCRSRRRGRLVWAMPSGGGRRVGRCAARYAGPPCEIRTSGTSLTSSSW